MMMKSLVVLALCVMTTMSGILMNPPTMGSMLYPNNYIGDVNAAIVPGVCQTTQLLYCQSMFNTVAGIPDGNDFNNPYQLAQEIDLIWLSNVAGYAQICNARNTFQSCLGPNYQACMAPTFYLQQGYNDSWAYAYQAIFTQLSFVCSSGLQVGTDGFKCTAGSFTQLGSQMYNNCAVPYNQTFTNCAGAQACICNAGQVYGNCIGNITAGFCASTLPAYTAPGGWWACGLTLSDSYLFGCPSQCQVSTFGTPSG